MKKILSLLDAWEIAKTEIKKRIELYTITLSYDQSCDELDYSFYYRERTINIFRRRNTFFDMLINAHTGEIIYHINTNEFKSEMRYNRCD